MSAICRVNDPEIGRWLTPDPLGFVDGFNPYVFVHNNPVNFVDPNGLLGERIANWWQGISDSIQNIDWNSVAASTAFFPAGSLGIEAVEGAGKVIVIGEDMPNRVIPYAKSIGAEFYNPTQTIEEMGGLKQALQSNIAWIIEKVEQGYSVINIGPKGENPTSFFYKAEIGVLKKLGVKTQ